MEPIAADSRWTVDDRSAEVEVRHWRGQLRVTCPDDVYFAEEAVEMGGEYRFGRWWFAMRDREQVVQLCCDCFGGVGDVVKYVERLEKMAQIAKARKIAAEEAGRTGSRSTMALVEALDCKLWKMAQAEDEP